MMIRAFIFLLSFSFCNFFAYAVDNEKKKCDESLTLNGQPIQVTNKDKKKVKQKNKKDKNKAVENKKVQEPKFTAEDREKMLSLLKGLLANPNDPRGSTLRDKLSSLYVRKLKEGVNSYWTIGLMLGNPGVQYNEKEISQLKTFITKIVERGWLIVHDANSAAAPIISEVAGTYSVAIGTAETSENLRQQLPNFIMINDPYLRLETFEKMDRRSFSLDSIAGMAVFLNGEMISHVPFQRSHLKDKTSEWAPLVGEPSLGYRPLSTPEQISLGSYSKKAEPKKIDMESILTSLDNKDLARLLSFTNEITNGHKAIDEHTKGAAGALVIGSSRLPGYYTQDLYRIVKYFASVGVPITTGGSGGVMEVANAAAYDAGGISIGIPIVGGAALADEKDIASDEQTLTIGTSGYTSRIPLLIRDKKFIIVAPGGTGTMQEIAVLLMKQSVNPDPELVWTFIGKKYYGNLVAGLKKYLPESVSRSMFVVNSREEAVELYNELIKTVWSKLDYSRFGTSGQIIPRNDKTSYEEPTTSSPWEFDYDF